MLIAAVWLVSILYFLAVGGVKYFLLAALLNSALAYQFWRMAKAEIFPAALCCFMIADVAIVLTATALSLPEFWLVFLLNRVFEVTLAYIIGASIYRIRKLRSSECSSASADEGSLKFIAG